MKTRRTFLTAVASGGVALSLAAPESAIAQVTPAPLTPAPLATATSLPSFGAAAFAAKMRAEIDPALTQDQLDVIARAIDANSLAARTLNPKKKRLANSAGPAVHFMLADGPP